VDTSRIGALHREANDLEHLVDSITLLRRQPVHQRRPERLDPGEGELQVAVEVVEQLAQVGGAETEADPRVVEVCKRVLAELG